MKEINFRKTELSFSILIHKLYGGSDYRRIKSYCNLSSTKKYYLKITKSIKFSIEETLTITDNNHKQELLHTIDKYLKNIKSAKNFYFLDQIMITLQSELIFLLIGLIPIRWQSDKVINRRKIWKLDTYRQIQYTQSIEQKKNLIFKAIKGKYKNRFGDWSDFLEIYLHKCNNKPERLIYWIKKNHPDIFIDLF